MKIVMQRVQWGAVNVEPDIERRIGSGLVCLVGIGKADAREAAIKLAGKVAQMRIFADEAGKMNLDVRDVKGEVLAISQFTLYADLAKGRRPSFVDAEAPEAAERLFDFFCDELSGHGVPVKKGVFGAHMEVSLLNDGPVTILLDV